MPDGKGGKLCPICDSPLEAGSKKCGFCGTDLAIFDDETEEPRVEEKSEAEAKEADAALDTKLEEVFFGPVEEAQSAEEETKPPSEPSPVEPETPAVEPEAAPSPEPAPEQAVVSDAGPEPKQESEPEASAVSEPPQKPSMEETTPSEEYFECPQCSARVPSASGSCPGCGVMFADEGADMFQCPACDSLVNIDATSCPGCGALFVESDEAALAEQQIEPVPEAKPELERPVEQVMAEPEMTEDEELQTEEAEGAIKGIFGSIFGKMKKKRKQEPEEEAEPILHMRERPRIISEEPAAMPTRTRLESRMHVEPAAEKVAEAPRPAAERPMAAAPTPSKHKPKELARLTAEMQPLMRLASDNGVDVSESRRLVDEGAMSARARQIDRAFDSVMKARDLLTKSLSESAEQMISDLREEINVAKALGGDVSRTAAYLDQLKKADDAGDFEAVFVYAGKVKNELLPITGRYNESKQKLGSLTDLVADSEMIDVDTKEARMLLVEATRAFEGNEFDKVDETVRSATKSLYALIEPRMDDEIRRARNQLVEIKAKGSNITPMITVLKSARTLMKAKDYQHALKEMREFKQQIEKAL